VKAVVVLATPPLPEGGAPGRCAVALVRGLRQHGVDVTTLAARQHFDVAGEPPADLQVEVVDIEPLKDVSRLRRLSRPRPELFGGELARRTREAAESADVVHVDETAATWVTWGLDAPSLVHVHYLALRDRPFGPPWRKQFREVLEFTLAERAAVRHHRYLVANSPVVAEELRRLAPFSHVAHVPLALDPRYYDPAPLDGVPTAGMIGTAAWPPTASALRRLAGRVWPLVRRDAPSARLLVAGRGSAEFGFSAEGAEVLGEIDSAPEFLRRLSVLLYPVERGSGMKVKVMEALASGVPVVTTAAGAEGIEPGEGVVVAESDEELARAAASILTDEGERRERGAAARETFLRNYAPGPATEPLLELYERMARRR
jgi:glycosyltransferase involved in cell wall biosynthesis